jgi:hypothetical protein
VSSRPDGSAYLVQVDPDGPVFETRLEASFLGAATGSPRPGDAADRPAGRRGAPEPVAA